MKYKYHSQGNWESSYFKIKIKAYAYFVLLNPNYGISENYLLEY